MTDPELQGLAAQALNMALRDIEQTGRFSFLLASCHPGESLHRMTRIEAIFIATLGEDWLNDGRKKNAGFSTLREFCSIRLVPVIIFASATNQFKPTKKFDGLTRERQMAILGGGHDVHHKAALDGYLRIVDSIMCIAQTPERVCVAVMPKAEEGKTEFSFSDQQNFGGRLKMFGKPSPESAGAS